MTKDATVGCPSTGGCWKLEKMDFYGCYAHVRIPLDEQSAKLTKFGSHTPLLPIYTQKTAKKGLLSGYSVVRKVLYVKGNQYAYVATSYDALSSRLRYFG